MMQELLLSRVKARVAGAEDGSKDALLRELLSDAIDAVKAYIAREELPLACQSAVVRLCAVLYNRVGMEGESSHQEGGVSVVADALPEDVKAMLRPYRLSRTV